jgi:hypothetical protein
MKDFLDQSRQMLQSIAAKVGNAINPPLSADARPLDIQHAVLEAIEARAQPVGGGRRRLPDTLVRVKVLAKDAAEERTLHLVLGGLREKAVARLREMHCDIPAGFHVDVACVRRRPSSWSADRPMAVEFENVAPDAASGAQAPGAAASSGQPALVLTIVRGRANAASYTLCEGSVRVGRSETPIDDRGHARFNHVAFAEEDDAHSRTVGRGHCEIRYDAANGGYRIFDERSANGTRIIRDGRVIDVPPQDPFGVAICDGDVLEFGTAAARVTLQRAP